VVERSRNQAPALAKAARTFMHLFAISVPVKSFTKNREKTGTG